jgi:hypothetical protein
MLVKTDAHFHLRMEGRELFTSKAVVVRGVLICYFGVWRRLPYFPAEFPPHRQLMTRWSEVQMKETAASQHHNYKCVGREESRTPQNPYETRELRIESSTLLAWAFGVFPKPRCNSDEHRTKRTEAETWLELW